MKKSAWAAAVCVCGLAAASCGSEPYTSCTLPSNDTIRDACGGGASSGSTNSCVVDFVFECDTQLCGTYEGSAPFCTQRCDGPQDTSCPQGGRCEEFVPSTGVHYCVP